MPTRRGSIFQSLEWCRVRLRARWASIIGPSAFFGAISPSLPCSRVGTRYFRTIAATPRRLSHSATSDPSRSQTRMLNPPPGQITMAAPFACSGGGRWTSISGLETWPSRISGRPAIRLSSALVVSRSSPSTIGAGPGISRFSQSGNVFGCAATGRVVNKTRAKIFMETYFAETDRSLTCSRCSS